MKMYPNLFPLNKNLIHTQAWPGWIYLNYRRLCNICKAQPSPKIQWHAVGLGTEWLRRVLAGTLQRKKNSSKMWNPPRHSQPVQGPDKNTAPPEQGIGWYFPGGKFHTIFGAQDGADTWGRMKSPCFLQIKTFIASFMVHPKPELPSHAMAESWDDASSTTGSLMQHLPLESSVSSSRDLSLIQEL